MKPFYIGVNTLNFLYWLILSPSNSLESHLRISCIWACLASVKTHSKWECWFHLSCIPVCREKNIICPIVQDTLLTKQYYNLIGWKHFGLIWKQGFCQAWVLNKEFYAKSNDQIFSKNLYFRAVFNSFPTKLRKERFSQKNLAFYFIAIITPKLHVQNRKNAMSLFVKKW